MSTIKGVDADLARIERQLQKKLHRRRGNLSGLMRRAGRRLPARAHRAAGEIAAAQELALNPRLARTLDAGRLKAPVRVLDEAVATYDPGKERLDFWLSVLRSLAFNLLALAVVLGLLARWRGLI
ncbi:hypothetical protein [Pseudooceanicola algae]|uniref:Uncharacterized protein n=1 Tax=Pseudooceanicola algae TaxID=1537215 RepID=A0A418SI06_9RHOB|nr:hypothetical protein [Pseudooceanicola algae]QPM92122.1 hypothetical protein PSAL_033850 [Pseudooceanicola algae]